jgi:hypothetical protein
MVVDTCVLEGKVLGVQSLRTLDDELLAGSLVLGNLSLLANGIDGVI